MNIKKVIALTLTTLMILTLSVIKVSAAESENAEQESAVEESTQAHKKPVKREKTAEPENAIGKDAAKEAALKDKGITADQVEKVRARVLKLDDGTVIYKVGFTYGDIHYSYKIDALTGKILDKTEQDAAEYEASKPKSKHGRKTDKATGEQSVDSGASEKTSERPSGGKNRSADVAPEGDTTPT